jgi:hypothetical protein
VLSPGEESPMAVTREGPGSDEREVE